MSAVLLAFSRAARSQRLVCSNVHLMQRYIHSLRQDKAFVNGQWVGARQGATFEVTNPVNEKVIGTVPDMDVNDASEAIDAAYAAFYSKQWHNSTAKERAALLKVRQLIGLNGMIYISVTMHWRRERVWVDRAIRCQGLVVFALIAAEMLPV